MRKRWIAACVLGGTVLLGSQGVGIAEPAVAWAKESGASAEAGASTALAAPTVSLESGRYIGAQSVTLTAEQGAEIRYTLDGTEPTRKSPLYAGPILVERSANLTAVAFTKHDESQPVIRGLLIKTAEKPSAQFAVMSDIHLSSDSPDLVSKWQTYFDTLKRIAPDADAIVSNGDQINDNNYNTAADHRFPRAMLEQNMARTGMTDTDVFMTFGNHDDFVNRMAAEYPSDWFPGASGYYETEIGGFPAFMVNTESWNTAQANWLFGRLTAISQDPKTQDKPIFVFGHKPIPSTVWDGAQASNAGLKTNLSSFPQVVYFSGHSHLNISDERSIHQESFTSINEGSMSYEEIDSMFQPFGVGLAKEHTVPTAQSVVVEVYGDRVEVDRINYSADEGRTYDNAGVWGFQKNPPFKSTGSLAGPSWVIGRGEDPAAVKAKFTYTQANRNKTAPAWGEATPTVRETENGPVLRLPQASDDQFVNDYTLEVTDLETGQRANLVPAGGRVYADYIVAPRPAALDIPLAVRANNKTGQPVDRTLVDGRKYEAKLVAYDSYRNASPAQTFQFTAGVVDRAELDTAIERAEAAIASVGRVLGTITPALPEDLGFAIADADAAEQRVAALKERLGTEPATQDAADAEAREIATAASELEALLTSVDRSKLAVAIENATRVLEGEELADELAAAAAPGEAAAKLRAAIERATGVVEQLNRSQQQLDDATDELEAAVTAYQDAGDGGDGDGGDGDGGDGGDGDGTDTDGPDVDTDDKGSGTDSDKDSGSKGSNGAKKDSNASGNTAGDGLAVTGAPEALTLWTAGAAAVLLAGGAWAAVAGVRARRSRDELV